MMLPSIASGARPLALPVLSGGARPSAADENAAATGESARRSVFRVVAVAFGADLDGDFANMQDVGVRSFCVGIHLSGVGGVAVVA